MPMEDLQTFEKLAEQVINNMNAGRATTLKAGPAALAAFQESLALTQTEIKRRKHSTGRRPVDPTDTKAAAAAAKVQQYRKTGSTKGWQELLAKRQNDPTGPYATARG